MCEFVEIDQDCKPAEIAMIISGMNPDISLSKRHKEMLVHGKSRDTYLRRRKIQNKLEDQKIINGESCPSMYITEPQGNDPRKARKLNEAQYDSMRKVFAHNL